MNYVLCNSDGTLSRSAKPSHSSITIVLPLFGDDSWRESGKNVFTSVISIPPRVRMTWIQHLTKPWSAWNIAVEILSKPDGHLLWPQGLQDIGFSFGQIFQWSANPWRLQISSLLGKVAHALAAREININLLAEQFWRKMCLNFIWREKDTHWNRLDNNEWKVLTVHFRLGINQM